MVNQKRKAVAVSDSPVTPAKRQATRNGSKRVTRKGGSAKNVESESHPAEHFTTPSNPQATFEGLPAELRLQVYDYLCDSTIIHVHRHEKTNTSKFTWTPCRAPNLKSPLLCANPKWSGMCDEEDRCTHKLYAPPEPRGFWALAAASKFIRNEAQEFFFKKTVVSIDPRNLQRWLDHLEKHAPKQLDSLRRINLAGPNVYDVIGHCNLGDLQNRIPNLEGVGMQLQDSSWRWFTGTLEIHQRQWKNNHNWILQLRQLQPTIDVAFEALIWRKHYKTFATSTQEQQAAIRIYRKGKTLEEGGTPANTPWQDSDVVVEIDKPGNVRSHKRNAKWRQWWRTPECKNL